MTRISITTAALTVTLSLGAKGPSHLIAAPSAEARAGIAMLIQASAQG